MARSLIQAFLLVTGASIILAAPSPLADNKPMPAPGTWVNTKHLNLQVIYQDTVAGCVATKGSWTTNTDNCATFELFIKNNQTGGFLLWDDLNNSRHCGQLSYDNAFGCSFFDNFARYHGDGEFLVNVDSLKPGPFNTTWYAEGEATKGKPVRFYPNPSDTRVPMKVKWDLQE